MRIEIRKISFQPKDFEFRYTQDDAHLVLKGVFYKKTSKEVRIEALLEGTCSVQCSRTSEIFSKEISEKLLFLISDGIYKGFNEQYDVIESLDGYVDFKALVESEVAAIRSDYNFLDSSENNDEFIWEDKELT